MRKASSKALYLFLCSILGMVLFAMLHRSIFVLYDILLFSNFSTYSFGLSTVGIGVLDFLTMLGALFLGGWYGVLLGMDWYAIVYGPTAEKPAGLFHGFLPHHWRNGAGKKTSTISKHSAPTTTSTFVNVPVVEKIKQWSFDDFITPKAEPKKRVAVKASAKKGVRKTIAKRVVKTES